MGEKLGPVLANVVRQSVRLQEAMSPAVATFAAQSLRLNETIGPSLANLVNQSARLREAMSPAVVTFAAQSLRLNETIGLALGNMASQSARLQEAISPTVVNIGTHLTKLHESITLLQNHMNVDSLRLSEAILPITTSLAAESISSAIVKFTLVNSTFIITLSRLSELIKNIDIQDLKVNSDGTISFQDDVFRIEDIKYVVENCITDSIGVQEPRSFESILNKILEVASGQHSIIKIVIFNVLLPILINIFTSSLFTSQTNNYVTVINQNKTVVIKNIKHEVQKVAQFDKSFFYNYRFVTATSLKVWSKHNTKSRKVGQIYFGQVVRVIYKQKNWTFIECSDEEGRVFLRGWVFTRYLSRFK